MPRPDFRSTAARRLAEEGELSPAVISLLSSDAPSRVTGVRNVPLDRIEASPDQPRLAMDQGSLNELAASIREHGVLQPILVRPIQDGRYQLIAGERRWRAARQAGLTSVPALIEQIDDETALEIALIENLQREDLSPLDEAIMYERMTRERGYSVRKLAQKIGKDKGYVENRLRLADAPDEVKELVSLRKDTVSHAYELLKVEDPKKRRRLAEQVASGELSLVKLRDRIEGRPTRTRERRADEEEPVAEEEPPEPPADEAPFRGLQDEETLRATAAWTGRPARVITEESLVQAKGHLAEAIDELVEVLRSPDAQEGIASVDRNNLAKYLMIAKLRLENVITLVRTGSAVDDGSAP
ncbi:MAG: ParB/RepB/Spo0J family partition protein [Chloroflexota bacterium]|nr:ParB/RepB/Spo0J family partition protein [Chloroflexota bacterium]